MVAVVVLVVLDPPELVGLAFLAAIVLPAFWSWGHVHAHVALNDDLDDVSRTRWRVALWFPGTIALYWLRYVR